MQLRMKLINTIIGEIMSDIKKEYDFSKAQKITDFENGKFFINDIGLTTVIPVHNEDLTRGLIRKILKDINITIDEYEKLKKEI